MLSTVSRIMQQFFGRRSTNVFPVKYAPESVIDALAGGDIHPPISMPEGYRGKLSYDFDKCIGCGMCLKVCPAKALEDYPIMDTEKNRPSKRIVFYRGKCTYCEECVKVCPVGAIKLNPDFMMANYEKYGDDQIEGIEKRREFEVKEGQ